MDDSHPFRSLSIGRPILEIKLFQTLTLKLQGQGHGCDQRAGSYNRPSIILTHFLFISHQSDPTIPEIELFRNLTLKHPRSRSWVRSKVKVTYCTKYPTNALPFYFHINWTNHSWDMAKIVFDLEKTHPKFIRKFAKITVFNIKKCNQVIPMTRTTKLPRFVLIRWVVLTLSCRQTNFC